MPVYRTSANIDTYMSNHEHSSLFTTPIFYCTVFNRTNIPLMFSVYYANILL
jgi:hypothetical protein